MHHIKQFEDTHTSNKPYACDYDECDYKYMSFHTQVGSIVKVSLYATINALPCLEIIKPIENIAAI